MKTKTMSPTTLATTTANMDPACKLWPFEEEGDPPLGSLAVTEEMGNHVGRKDGQLALDPASSKP